MPDEEIKVAVSTSQDQYWLNDPSDIYQDIFHVLSEKVNVTKVVYTLLRRSLEQDQNYTYIDLIEDFENENNNELFEQDLLNCGKFVVDQILSFEQAAEKGEVTILDNNAFEELAKYSNADGSLDGFIKSKSRKNRIDRARKRGVNRSSPVDYYYSSSSDDEKSGTGQERRPKKATLEGTRATTTPLVAHFFESVFGSQMAEQRTAPKG